MTKNHELKQCSPTWQKIFQNFQVHSIYIHKSVIFRACQQRKLNFPQFIMTLIGFILEQLAIDNLEANLELNIGIPLLQT